MKTVEIEIKGISPLLMHAFPMVVIEGLDKMSKEDQAEHSTYRKDGKLYVPGINVQRALVAAASFSKGKGRASLQKIVAACVIVEEAEITLTVQTYNIDSRPVVIPSTKGRILRHRPRFDVWGLRFHVQYDEVLMTGTQLRRVVDDCGSRVGLLDFRPERKGSFGRFMVTHWKEVDENGK